MRKLILSLCAQPGAEARRQHGAPRLELALVLPCVPWNPTLVWLQRAFTFPTAPLATGRDTFSYPSAALGSCRDAGAASRGAVPHVRAGPQR